MSQCSCVETVDTFGRIEASPGTPAAGTRGGVGGRNGPAEPKTTRVFRPLMLANTQGWGGVAKVPDVCHRHLWVCGTGSWCVKPVTNTQIWGRFSVCVFTVCACIFNMRPSHVAAPHECACKSWLATGPWHSLSSCHSKSPAALWENSCGRRNKMSWLANICSPALHRVGRRFKEGGRRRRRRRRSFQLPAYLALEPFKEEKKKKTDVLCNVTGVRHN